MPVHKHTRARTHTWRKHETQGGHMQVSVLTCLIKYDHCTWTHTHTWHAYQWGNASSRTKAICSIYHVGKHTVLHNVHIHTEASVYSHTCPFPLYVIWHMTHTYTHSSSHTTDPRAHTGHLQYVFYSVYPVQLSAVCQCVQLPGKQPRLLPIIKYAFKMSLTPKRAKAEATNRFTLVVQLTLAWTPTLPLFPPCFFLFLSFFCLPVFLPFFRPFFCRLFFLKKTFCPSLPGSPFVTSSSPAFSFCVFRLQVHRSLHLLSSFSLLSHLFSIFSPS